MDHDIPLNPPLQYLIACSLLLPISLMDFIDNLSLSLSLLGIYGLILHFRYLFPRSIIPPLSALLNETRQLLDRAEEIGAVPPQSECRTHLDW